MNRIILKSKNKKCHILHIKIGSTDNELTQ